MILASPKYYFNLYLKLSLASSFFFLIFYKCLRINLFKQNHMQREPPLRHTAIIKLEIYIHNQQKLTSHLRNLGWI